MILSRVWYVILGLAVAVALYVVFVAVGQYNRATTRSLKEGLASDSQTVEWALKIDARRRLDALLTGAVDPALQKALVEANGKDKVPPKSRDDARKALALVGDKIPQDYRPDALFAVDRDGRVVGAQGFEVNDDFELGGYPAVFDALHGWLRDDTWVLGSKMYIVVARPVEYDVTQRPAGAIVGLKEIGRRFAGDLAKRTRTSLAFYASGQRVTSAAGVEGFDEEKLDVSAELKAVGDDATYAKDGRSDVRMTSDDLGAMYARLPGEAWTLGGGFAVMRGKTSLAGPMAFLSNADDRDKANVPWLLLAGVVLLAVVVGIGLTLVEHGAPLRELVMQAERFKAGAMDGLQVARFRGAYRLAAQSVNQGIERAIEKSGGVTRKPADLESILGPAPAQPAMSAFAFPMDGGSQPGVAPPASSGAAVRGGEPPAPPVSLRQTPPSNEPIPAMAFPEPPAAPRPPPPVAQRRPSPVPVSIAMSSPGGAASGPGAAPNVRPPPPAPSASLPGDDDDDETMVAQVPAEVMKQATGQNRAVDESAEWQAVYEDFIRTKKQCGEQTDGLTFDKFSHTLKKNRDQLALKHGCRRVKFTVYVKEGRASLKATPVKD